MQKINFQNNQAPGISAGNLKLMQDNIEDAINNIIKIIPIQFTIGTIEANSDKYGQTYEIPSSSIPSGYTPVGIIGYQLSGTYYSHCLFSNLYISNGNIAYAIKNTSSSNTGSIQANIKILTMKTS